jgi:hypothetical protein
MKLIIDDNYTKELVCLHNTKVLLFIIFLRKVDKFKFPDINI